MSNFLYTMNHGQPRYKPTLPIVWKSTKPNRVHSDPTVFQFQPSRVDLRNAPLQTSAVQKFMGSTLW